MRQSFPSGKIAREEPFKFDNAEIKTLMIDVVNQPYCVLFHLFWVRTRTRKAFLSALPRPRGSSLSMFFGPARLQVIHIITAITISMYQ